MSEATFDPKKYNKSKNTPISNVMEQEISRRNLLKGSVGLSALGLIGGFGLTGCSSDSDPALLDDGTGVGDMELTSKLGFESINGSLTDSVVVPPGYSAQVLAPWGTPLNSKAAVWKDDGTNTAEDQLNAVGMHHDGIRYFPLNGSSTEAYYASTTNIWIVMRCIRMAQQNQKQDCEPVQRKCVRRSMRMAFRLCELQRQMRGGKS